MGINRRRSLHPKWTQHHIQVIDGFKTCTVRITRRNQDVTIIYDEVTKTYSDPNTVIYEGQARLQPYGINEDLEVANDPTARRLVLVQVAGKNLEINNDDVLVVVSSENDVGLEHFSYDIRGSIGSSLEWGTNLVCEANLKMKL